MTHRSFTNEPAEDGTKEQVSFDITGTYSESYRKANPEAPETWTETFTLVSDVPVGVLALYQRVAQSSGDGTTVYQPGSVMSFLAAVIDQNVDEGRTRFFRLCDDGDRLVQLSTLVDVLQWAAEQLLERPTGPATTSQGG